MPALSKTGLIPSVRKKLKFDVQTKTTLDVSNLAVPAPYIMRPFAGIYNPFPYGCSVLCNHPADLEAKNVVKKAKDVWAIEGRALLSSEDVSQLKYKKFPKHQDRSLSIGELGDTVPEELFRRYTDTDSRPITPTPTVISLTKHAQWRRRRCMTPEPLSSIPNKEKTMLVLDLRRSHSQETITWIGSQQGESFIKIQTTATGTSRTASSISRTTGSSRKKKPLKRTDTVLTSKSSKYNMQSSRSCSSKLESKSLLLSEPVLDGQINRIQSGSSGNTSEVEVIKRRGKKKKGKRSGNTKEGDKEFQGFPEPGETQMSTLGNDSRLGSTRPSLTATTGLVPCDAEGEQGSDEDVTSRKQSKKESFLDSDILKLLQRQLDHEVVESELNQKRKIALKEAFRLIPKSKSSKRNHKINELKQELSLPSSQPEKWLSVPRVFTRQSCRFELPMDSRMLNHMKPLEYAEKFVFPSEERLVLYNHVFNLHMEESDGDEDDNMERILLGKNVIPSLGDVMGRLLTDEEASDFQSLIEWSDEANLEFRTFAGIAGICERLFAHRFCSSMPSSKDDLKHEVERADFESLDIKLMNVTPDKKMVRILKGIRDL